MSETRPSDTRPTDRRPTTRRPRWRRALLYGTLALLGAAGLVALGAFGLMRSDPGRRWIADAVERALSRPGELELSIERLDGRLPREIRLTGLRLGDADGAWLSAKSVALDWSPLTLLSGKLRVALLRADDVILDRMPEAAAPDQPAPDQPAAGLPSLPFEIAVERLSVANLELGEAILGRRGRFRIEGRAAAKDAEGVLTALTIERSDGAPGRASLNALYRPQDDRLRLEASIEEPAGGLIARLSDLPDLPAIQARLEGDGALRDWRGRLTLRLDDLLSMESQIALARGEAFRFDLAGHAKVQGPAKSPPPGVLEALVAGGVSFALAGRLNAGQDLTLERARIESAAARLMLSGNLAFDPLAIDVEAEADILNPGLGESLIPGLRARGLKVSVHAVGPALRPRLDARIRAAAMSAPGLSAGTLAARLAFTPDRPLDQGPPEGALSGEGSIAGLALDGMEPLAPLLGDAVRWQVEGRLENESTRIAAQTLTLEAGPARLSASGTLDLRAETIEADARLTLSDLAGLSPLLGLGLKGHGEVDAWIESPDLGRTATAVMTGDLRDLTLDRPILDALLGGATSLAANLSLAADGAVTARDIVLDTPALRLAGNLAVPADFARIEADYDATIPDLGALAGPLGLDLAGRATLRGRARGAIGNPALTGRAGFAGARVEGVAIERADVTYTADDPAGQARGKVEATAAGAPGGALGGILGEVAVAADFRFADPDLRLTGLEARSRGATVMGEVTVPLDGRPLTAALKGEAPDLAPWLALAGLAGGGAAEIDLRLSAEGRRQGGALTATVTRPLVRLAPDRVLRAETARFEVIAADLTGDPKGRARLRTTELALDELVLDRLSLEADGGATAFDWRLDGDGAWRGPLNLKAEGRLETAAPGLSVEIAHLKGQALERAIVLRAPVILTQEAETLTLGPLDLAFGEAAIKARGEIGSARLSGRLTIDDLPLASLAAVLPLAEANGTLSASLEVAGPRANPSGAGKIEVRDIDMGSILQDPALDPALDPAQRATLGLTLDTAWRDGRLKLSGAVSGLPGSDAALAAELPLRLDPASLTPMPPLEEPISGQITWRGEMAALWPLVPLDGHSLSGDTEVRLNLAGTATRPRLDGAFSLTGGEYENLDAGTLLQDLDARIEFSDRRARIARLTASDGAKGSLSASGEIALDAGADFPFNVAARMTDFIAVRRDEVNVTTDGEVTLKGTLGDILLAGRFETKLVEIRIVDSLPPEVVTLDVVESGAGAKAEALRSHAAKSETASAVVLDVAVEMPRRVFVRGRGLDSEWSGNLKVTGSPPEPRIVGEVKLVRGQLSLLTRTFRLTGGSVRFPPGPGAVPELDVTAEHKAGDVTAVARISGAATNPGITLGSTPELPRDEIVSRVLFGKKRGRLSPLEAAQLAAAVGELTGAGGATGVLDTARNLIGADVLRVGGQQGGGTGGPSVEAGKYAAEGVYLGVKKGVTDRSGAVAVEIELTPNISVGSETGTTGESDIGVKFKWDY